MSYHGNDEPYLPPSASYHAPRTRRMTLRPSRNDREDACATESVAFQERTLPPPQRGRPKKGSSRKRDRMVSSVTPGNGLLQATSHPQHATTNASTSYSNSFETAREDLPSLSLSARPQQASPLPPPRDGDGGVRRKRGRPRLYPHLTQSRTKSSGNHPRGSRSNESGSLQSFSPSAWTLSALTKNNTPRPFMSPTPAGGSSSSPTVDFHSVFSAVFDAHIRQFREEHQKSKKEKEKALTPTGGFQIRSPAYAPIDSGSNVKEPSAAPSQNRPVLYGNCGNYSQFPSSPDYAPFNSRNAIPNQQPPMVYSPTSPRYSPREKGDGTRFDESATPPGIPSPSCKTPEGLYTPTSPRYSPLHADQQHHGIDPDMYRYDSDDGGNSQFGNGYNDDDIGDIYGNYDPIKSHHAADIDMSMITRFPTPPPMPGRLPEESQDSLDIFASNISRSLSLSLPSQEDSRFLCETTAEAPLSQPPIAIQCRNTPKFVAAEEIAVPKHVRPEACSQFKYRNTVRKILSGIRGRVIIFGAMSWVQLIDFSGAVEEIVFVSTDSAELDETRKHMDQQNIMRTTNAVVRFELIDSIYQLFDVLYIAQDQYSALEKQQRESHYHGRRSQISTIPQEFSGDEKETSVSIRGFDAVVVAMESPVLGESFWWSQIAKLASVLLSPCGMLHIVSCALSEACDNENESESLTPHEAQCQRCVFPGRVGVSEHHPHLVMQESTMSHSSSADPMPFSTDSDLTNIASFTSDCCKNIRNQSWAIPFCRSDMDAVFRTYGFSVSDAQLSNSENWIVAPTKVFEDVNVGMVYVKASLSHNLSEPGSFPQQWTGVRGSPAPDTYKTGLVTALGRVFVGPFRIPDNRAAVLLDIDFHNTWVQAFTHASFDPFSHCFMNHLVEIGKNAVRSHLFHILSQCDRDSQCGNGRIRHAVDLFCGTSSPFSNDNNLDCESTPFALIRLVLYELDLVQFVRIHPAMHSDRVAFTDMAFAFFGAMVDIFEKKNKLPGCAGIVIQHVLKQIILRSSTWSWNGGVLEQRNDDGCSNDVHEHPFTTLTMNPRETLIRRSPIPSRRDCYQCVVFSGTEIDTYIKSVGNGNFQRSENLITDLKRVASSYGSDFSHMEITCTGAETRHRGLFWSVCLTDRDDENRWTNLGGGFGSTIFEALSFVSALQ